MLTESEIIEMAFAAKEKYNKEPNPISRVIQAAILETLLHIIDDEKISLIVDRDYSFIGNKLVNKSR